MNIPAHKKVTAVGRAIRRFTKRKDGEYESPLESVLAGFAACLLVVALFFFFGLMAELLK